MRIRDLTLPTRDLDSMRHFYGEVLAFSIVDNTNELVLEAGQSRVRFTLEEDFVGVYHFAFNIPRNTFDEALAWSQARVPLIPIDSSGNVIAEFTGWNARAMYFNDPAGNIVEFIARMTLANDSTHPFTPQSITELSEIGIVTSDIPGLRARIANDFAITDYERQQPSDSFAALGDETGLFIAVKEGRDWYPAGPAATATGVVARIEDGNGVESTFVHR